MKYKDYLNSARKHAHTCDILYDKLLNSTYSAEIKKSILLNMYYLSGYIIECIIKYGIYDLIGYDKDKDVKELNHGSLTFATNIKHHRFERYTEHLVRHISSPIPLITDEKGIDREVLNLYRRWDAEVRYLYDLGTNQDTHYIKFYQYSKKIMQTIRDNIGG